MLWAYIRLPYPFEIYGTLWILLIAFITNGIPLGVRLACGGWYRSATSWKKAHGARRQLALRLSHHHAEAHGAGVSRRHADTICHLYPLHSVRLFCFTATAPNCFP
jgi:hypothetical protein